MASPGVPTRSKLFLSYSHEDRPWLDQLLTHLKALVREQDIDWWADVRITPGDDWQRQIEAALAAARVAVLLVSKDFVASDFIHAVELPRLLAAAKSEGLRVLVVHVAPCLVPEGLVHFQAVNRSEATLQELGPAAVDRVLLDVLAAVRAEMGPAATASTAAPGGAKGAAELVGTVLGPYRIVREVGAGAVGRVYEAYHEQMRRRVAIKVLRPEFASDHEQIERMLAEVQVANVAAESTRGVVEVTDHGRLADDRPYLVMEYVAGEVLAARLGRGPLGVAALGLGWQVALTMAAVHGRGIVHRDLKPDNLMLVPDAAVVGGERVKVLDFGIAKLEEAQFGSWVSRLTRVGGSKPIGTPHYMAPEQADPTGREMTDRVDVYALGALFYHCMTGRPLYDGRELQVMYQHAYAPLPSFDDVLALGGPELVSLCQRMLAKAPGERLSMEEVAQGLGRLREGASRGEARREPGPKKMPAAPTVERGPTPGQPWLEPVTGMSFLWAPPGTFWMGSSRDRGEEGYDPDASDFEQPAHRVTLTDGYWMAEHPVTNEQYRRYLAETKAQEPKYWQSGRFNAFKQPVVGVSWEDARRFCAWLSGRAPLGQVWRIDLPTEAEWEYAARGIDRRRYPWGDEEPTAERACFAGASNAPLAAGGRPTGKSPFGCHDMAGNVWEWCLDHWRDSYVNDSTTSVEKVTGVVKNMTNLVKNMITIINPCHLQADAGAWRVVRGGSWGRDPWDLRAAFRGRYLPGRRLVDLGFRVVCRGARQLIVP